MGLKFKITISSENTYYYLLYKKPLLAKKKDMSSLKKCVFVIFLNFNLIF